MHEKNIKKSFQKSSSKKIKNFIKKKRKKYKTKIIFSEEKMITLVI